MKMRHFYCLKTTLHNDAITVGSFVVCFEWLQLVIEKLEQLIYSGMTAG